MRPLTFDGSTGTRASSVSRQHRVVAEGPGGRFLSITGTKLTCFRSLAEEVGRTVARLLGRGGPSDTARITLDGQDEEAGALEVRAMLDVTEAVRSSGLELEQVEMLVTTYGRRAGAVLDAAPAAAGGDGATLQERAGDRRPAALGRGERAGGLPSGRAPPPDRPRYRALPRPRLRSRDRPADGRAPRLEPRRVEAELDAYEGTVRLGLRFRSE